MTPRILCLVACSLLLSACPKKDEPEDAMTLGEASQAVEESSLDAQAASITSNTIELSTSFTIGAAVEEAAGEVKSFIESQLPCAEVLVQGATLSVSYGKKPGLCMFRGQTFSGTHSIQLIKTEPGELQVQHTWASVSNQRLKVDGSATVTWSASEQSRRVKHELTWTRLSDGRTGKGSGDRTQKALSGGLDEGIQIDGARSWTGANGSWDLAIRGVEVRWADPVPQAGSYTLLAPTGRSMSLTFLRLDTDTIQVTVASGARSFDIKVNATGEQG